MHLRSILRSEKLVCVCTLQERNQEKRGDFLVDPMCMNQVSSSLMIDGWSDHLEWYLTMRQMEGTHKMEVGLKNKHPNLRKGIRREFGSSTFPFPDKCSPLNGLIKIAKPLSIPPLITLA